MPEPSPTSPELPRLLNEAARSIKHKTSTREALVLEPHVRRYALAMRGQGVSLDGVRAKLRALLADSMLTRLDSTEYAWVLDQVQRWATDAYRRGD